MKKIRRNVLLLLFTSFMYVQGFAWNHSIEFGYGYSQDPNHPQYHNSGFLLSGDLLPLYRNWLTFWSVTGSVGQWHTTTPVNKNLTTGALSLALRWYPFTVANQYPFYFMGSAGPAILSHKRFGLNTQASNISIQTNVGFGMEFHCFDINLRLEHFSNANLGNPNEGFNILYLLSIGYLL